MLILSLTVVAKVESAPLVWSSDRSFPPNSLGIDQASSVIQAGDGKIWIVWEKEVSSGHAIYYSTSSDYGLTWSSGKNLTDIPNSNLNVDPSVVQLSNGTIMVAWSSQRPPPLPPGDFEIAAYPSALSIPVGSSGNSTIKVTSLNYFDDPVNLFWRILPFDDFVSASLNPNRVTPPPNGHANSTLTVTIGVGAAVQDYYVTVNGRGPPPLNLSHSTKVIVTPTSTLGTISSSSSPIPISASSSPDQTNDNYTLYYKTSNDLGATWSSENIVPLTNNLGHNLSPSVIQAADSTVWLVWTSTRVSPSNPEIFYKTCSASSVWSEDVRLTFNASSDSRPAITQTQDGRIWVVWHSNRYSPYEEIVYNIYDGAVWLGEKRLTNNTLADTAPVILQSQDGVIRVFWASCDMSLEGAHDIYYVESANNGASWSSPILFPTDTPEDVYPSVTQSIDSRIWVVRTTNKTGNWDIYFKTSLIHNVAVKKIVPLQVKVYQEEVVPVNVTIENQGDYNEPSIVVSLYANTTFIDTRTISLNSRASTIVSFNWNTLGFARGNYTMKAEANQVSGEVYVGDNVKTDGAVKVKLLGDINDDRIVEVRDLWAMGKAYASLPSSPNWNEEADLNGNNAVNQTDLSLLSNNYGETG